MTILIADDEKLARFQLKSMLCAAEPDDLMIYEAANGVKLVEQCRRYRPDVAFVDIRMPQMDGLAAIEQCRSYGMDTQFVITSGYSDFAFAQKSISLQVADYLLKPVDADELHALMQRLREKLHESRRELTRDFSLRVVRSFQLWEEVGFCPAEDPCAALTGEYFGFRFYLDCLPDAEEYRPAYLKLNDALQSLSRELAAQRILSALREPKEAGLDFIVYCDRRSSEQLRRRLEQLCRSLSQSTLAVSCLSVSAPELWSLFRATKEAAEQEEVRFGASGAVCALEALRFSPQERALLRAVSDLAERFQEADEAGYNKALERLAAMPDSAAAHIDFRRMTTLLGVCVGGKFSCGSVAELVRLLKKHRAHLYRSETNRRADKITYITDYVEKHYMEEISVVYLAEKLQLTPNYFSKIFHERVGKTFSAYITEVRIRHARRILLTRPDVKVRDVAVMVGYYSPRHFANIFRRLTGCYPSDYRDRQENEQEEPV